MRLSQYFLPVIKETPSEASIVSHRYMLRAGMIRQLSAGIYNWLPLGLAVLQKVQAIIRDEMNKAGGVEILMPTMQPIELWEESGRGGYGAETLKLVDRHERTMIYGPTNEEVVTDIFRKHVRSYKSLPLNLYQIQWKFRDEIRPRFGVMRGREFLMKDAYTFTADKESQLEVYDVMYRAYFRLFNRMGLTVIPVAANTGMIGGDLSHEFQVVAETGESEIFYDAGFEEAVKGELDFAHLKSLYSAADEKHDPAHCPVPESRLKTARGIEVGQVFYLGTKYSKAMKALVINKAGEEVPAEMGCHGVGVSRLVGAIIEASHDENGIIWPEAVAPFQVGLLNLRAGDALCDGECNAIYTALHERGISVLYDDTDDRAGEKFARMDLIGLPWQIIVGPKNAAEKLVELKHRKSGERHTISFDDAMARLSKAA